MPGPTVNRQFCDNFTHHAAELEAVTGEAGRNYHVGMLRMVVHDEVPIRRIGEHARLQCQRGPHSACKVRLRTGTQRLLILRVAFTIYAIRRSLLPEVVVLPNLESWNPMHGKAVEMPFRYKTVENRESVPG